MNRLQRYLWSACFALLGAGFLASSASAQQVFVKRLWVHNIDNGCFVGTAGGCRNDDQICCLDTCRTPTLACGNISNNPNLQFDNAVDAACTGASFITGTSFLNICTKELALCMSIGYANEQSGNTPFALDFISFEVFKFADGTNPLDASGAPPLRTFFVDNPGQIPAGQNSDPPTGNLPPVCVLWDGDINIKGEFGKSNGQYGFRSTIATNQTGASGNINITQTRAFPGGWTLDSNTLVVDEKPITVDVSNIHVVRTSPTVVGSLTGVAAEPYNITYRLAKDATTFLTVHQGGPGAPIVRTIVPGIARVGEGIPDGTLQNGDSWNGRFENGALGPPGVYLATIQAVVADQYGTDVSRAATRQISLDTLQITDLRTQPLTGLSTSLAVLSYVLTEPATIYVDIYPPGTAFTNGLNNVNNPILDVNPASTLGIAGAEKDFGATLGGVPVVPIRHFEEQKDFRKSVITFWDGRDASGQIMPDGDYVFVVYAALPSANGFTYSFPPADKRIWSTNARSGFLTISRGFVTVSQIGPSSTVIGSSPPVAGLDPFTFRYSVSREALVTLKVFDNTGVNLVKTLVSNEIRPGNFLNVERWITPTDDAGLWISTGNYLVQLEAADPFFPSKVSTTTALFPINLFRITDVNTSSLLTGSTDVVTISYQLSQPMNTVWNIYPPGTVVSGSSSTWPPCAVLEPGNCGQITLNGQTVTPINTIKGLRPGRLRITEFWDGRDRNGLFVPDGNYVYTLVAQSTTTPQYFATDKHSGILTVARGSIVFPIFNITPTFPALFNSSQTISLPPYEIDYSLTRQSSVTVHVLTTNFSPTVVRTLIAGQVRDANILNREFWDARDDAGNFVQPGFYTVRAIAEDLASVLSSGSTAQQTISVDPLRIYDVAISPLRADFGTALIAYQVSETMKVSIKIYEPGTSFDFNGNPTPPEDVSLVKRIVGVRPARTEISEIWDGTDETLSIVPDGNYIFKIVASTDINAIDSITGNLIPGAALAEDLVIAEIPVVRGGALSPSADFINNTFVYPNPMRGANATFRIYVPLQAQVTMKIYNIAGDLVLDKDFGEHAQDSYVTFPWDKTNQHGRKLAHGVYFYLVREETTRGEKVLFQSVKKFLIP
jgi:flagellar hook assembly protein FlgD